MCQIRFCHFSGLLCFSSRCRLIKLQAVCSVSKHQHFIVLAVKVPMAVRLFYFLSMWFGQYMLLSQWYILLILGVGLSICIMFLKLFIFNFSICCLFPGFAWQRISCSKAHRLQQACGCYGTCWWVSFVSSETWILCLTETFTAWGKVMGLGFFLVFYTEIAFFICYFVYRVLIPLIFWASVCDPCSVNSGEFVTHFCIVCIYRLPCTMWFCIFWER